MANEPPAAREQQTRTPEWYERQKSRERMKLTGLLILVLVILLIAFVRFGKTIPWGAG
ncbi:MAG TPA: hypothetical protein VFC15_13035 [Candidatus Limnocylindrales bacterium]|nr:hypothetical protein [Candidatus Limnocylindrales bacterium]